MNSGPEAISVVIPNYNGRQYLAPLLASLKAQSLRPSEIWVVDDASTDDSVAFLKSKYPEVQVLVNETNSGFAVTANRGLQAARSPLIALLNNDTVLDADWVHEASQPFQDPEVGVVATRIIYHDTPELVDSAGDLYLSVGIALKRGSRGRVEELDTAGQPVFSACAAAAMYRRQALEGVGVFDERLEAYYEDVDLGFRLQRAGYRCDYAHQAVCRHHVSASYRPSSWRFHFLSSRNAELVFWSNLPLGLLICYLPGHLLFLVAHWLDKARQGHGLAFLAGKAAFLGKAAIVLSKRRQMNELARLPPGSLENRIARNSFSLLREARRGPVNSKQ